MPTYKVLAIDGGGIRGIIPAMVLAEIEARKQKPIAELFDLIAGASTGALITLALTTPGDQGRPRNSAADVVSIYETESSEVFSIPLMHQVRSLGGLVEEKFPSGPKATVVKKYVGNATLSQALTEVLVPAYELERRTEWFFRSGRAKQSSEYEFPMLDVAMAATAAPTAFEPHKIEPASAEDSPPSHYSLIDGGVFANNPAMCAWVDARAAIDEDADETLLVSLGTGFHTRPYHHEDAASWGLLEWLEPVIMTMLDGVADTVEVQLKSVAKEGHYFRFQIKLPPGLNVEDEAVSDDVINALKALANDLIAASESELAEVCSKL